VHPNYAAGDWVAFSADGKKMATLGAHSVTVWDTSTWRQLHSYERPESLTHQVVFSPDGNVLAASARNTVVFWDAATGALLRKLRAHPDSISHFAFSPDGKLLATADDPHVSSENPPLVRLWDLAAEKEVRTFAGHRTKIDRVAFSGDGKRLASCSDADGQQLVLIWDTETGKLHRRLQVEGHDGVCSPDGRTVAVRVDKEVHLWDVAAQQLLHRLDGEDNYVSCFSSDGRMLAAGGSGGTAVWEVASGKLLRSFPATESRFSSHRFSYPLAFSPDGKLLACIANPGVQFWQLDTSRAPRPPTGHRLAISCLAFAPGGRVLASGSDDRTVRLWEVPSGKELLAFEKHQKSVALIAFSPDGRTVASADEGGGAWLWEAGSGKALRRLDGLSTRVVALYFDADGRSLRAATEYGNALVWDTSSGAARHPLERAVLSPDPRYFVTPGSEGGHPLMETGTGFFDLRSLATGREVRRLQGHKEHYRNEAFTPDGRFLAAEAYTVDRFHGHVFEKGFRSWETASGREVLHLEDMRPPLAFSPDGSVMVCPEALAGDKEGLFVWRDATGRRLGQGGGHGKAVTALAFSADGRWLASGGADSTLLLWDAGPFLRRWPAHFVAPSLPLDQLWTDLAGDDAATAYAALADLVRRPAEAVPYLRLKLRPTAPPDPARIVRLIADLDSEQFAVRQKAAADLERLGEAAEDAIRKALAGKPSLEVRRCLERFVQQLQSENYTAEQLRGLRAVAVLERVGSVEARRVLEELSADAQRPRLAQEARAALSRRGPSPNTGKIFRHQGVKEKN
jgi:WD40 repeat protein